MPFVPVPDTAALDVIYSWDGQVVENTLYYRFAAGGPVESDLTALLEAVNTAIRANLIPLMTNAITFLRLVGTLLDVVDGLQLISTTSLPIAGENTGAAMPNNVAMCMSIRSAVGGRSGRGRNYIPGLPRSVFAANTLDATFAAALTGAYSDILAAGGDAGWEAVVVSRFTGGLPRTTGVANAVTSNFFVDRIVDSMRRRLPGRGA